MPTDPSPTRQVPIVVVASARAGAADEIAQHLRRNGAVVLAARSAEGCLRVATSVGPDVVLLDADLPPWVEKLLHAHPASRRARVLHLTSDGQPGAGVPLGLIASAPLAC
jgi:DNA-binding response OmpR family regulator